MKLLYRGFSYDFTPGAQTTKEAQQLERSRRFQPDFPLLYRGFAYRANPNAASNQPLFAPISNLIYRGLSFSLNGWQAEANPRTELKRVHRENLYRNVQHRLQVAREQGNQELISLLERELRQIV